LITKRYELNFLSILDIINHPTTQIADILPSKTVPETSSNGKGTSCTLKPKVNAAVPRPPKKKVRIEEIEDEDSPRSLSSSTDSRWNPRIPGIPGIKIWQGNQLIFIPIPAEFKWGLDSAKTIPGISGTELVLGMAGMEYISSKFIHSNMSRDFSCDNAFMLQSP
jgi:hypothetical protein